MSLRVDREDLSRQRDAVKREADLLAEELAAVAAAAKALARTAPRLQGTEGLAVPRQEFEIRSRDAAVLIERLWIALYDLETAAGEDG